MSEQRRRADVAAIIPTLGRATALEACLRSLAAQTVLPRQVIVVHSGDDIETRQVASRDWSASGFDVEYHHSSHAGAALQRDFAIRRTSLPWLLMCDDDVEFEPEWIAALLAVVTADPRIGAAMGRITNQPYLTAPGIWHFYRRLVASSSRADQDGAVLGALVPNGLSAISGPPVPTEWIGGGVTLLRRDAYVSVGGFAAHYRGSSPGEDVDLGYRLSRKWRLYYVPEARCVHHRVSSGREPIGKHQYFSMRSRFAFCRASAGMGTTSAFAQIILWAVFQTLSELGQLRRGRLRPDFLAACGGRVRGTWSCIGWDPTAERFPEWQRTHDPA